MKNSVPLWHRRNVKWTEKDIEALIEFRLIQFLPSTYATKQPRLDEEKKIKLQEKLAARMDQIISDGFPDKALRAKLDALVVELLPLRIPDEELDAKILKEIPKLIPSGAVFFVEPEGSDLKEILQTLAPDQKRWDMTLVLSAMDYVRVSLGFYPRLYRGKRKPDLIGGRHQQRRNGMTKTKQLTCVKEWTGVYDDIWTNPTWRECLWMRYDRHNPPAVELLPQTIRDRLHQEATRLREFYGGAAPSPEQITTASDGRDVGDWIGFAYGLLKFDYLSTLMADELDPSHRLYKRVNESGHFERVAVLEAERHCPAATRSNYVERFCRYLTVSSGHPDELVGRLILRMIKLEESFWEKEPGETEVPDKAKRLPKLRSDEMTPSDDFEVIAGWITGKLKIDRGAFTRLWADWCGLNLGRLWQRRAIANFTAYWMANVLEIEHPDVFRKYSKVIDDFLVDRLRPFLKCRGPNAATAKRNALSAFPEALLQDPLLPVVLHYVALGGKAEVTAPRVLRKHDKRRSIHLMVTHAYRVLTKLHPGTPTVSIEEILETEKLTSPQVLAALSPETRDDRQLGGFSLFSYVAPLVTAMINDGETVIRRDNAKTIYRRNKSNYLLVELESDPDRLLSRTVRGEVPL